ncbi:hypothetical protein AAJ76_2580001399 [Vairimorpha ceranae]|uniref:ISXO2-like transposase domain-containing protein n=1 Tax=Vairimorpha ceranae TaxID=40302 RepID=A0A0F9W9U7_9MICR|nr:hypothetical protein AAJ76_2580001399 [Vairimorpha ceranae]KKO73750.1 hypothetical protein AAJ76_2580001399 [Vairimorpha ceranae]
MRIMVAATYIDGYSYRCSSKACRSRESLKKGTEMASLNIEFVKIFRGMYCWVYDYTLAQAIDFCDCSETTYIKINDLILQVISEQEPEMVKMGGEGIGVQFDETAICNGELISNPSSTPDNKPNVQWLMGDIEGTNCRNFVLKLFTNRKIPTILDMFDEHVVPGSIIVTDGYPSYPGAVSEFGSCHEVVNHCWVC